MQYSMESRTDGLYISPRNPFTFTLAGRDDALGGHAVFLLKTKNLGAMLTEIGIGTPMVSFENFVHRVCERPFSK